MKKGEKETESMKSYRLAKTAAAARISRKRRMEDFLEAYRLSFGNVTLSCKNANIDDKTYYNWIKRFPEFVESCKRAKETFKDNAESKMITKMMAGDNTLLIFFAKTQMKDRGYIEGPLVQVNQPKTEGEAIPLSKLSPETRHKIEEELGLKLLSEGEK